MKTYLYGIVLMLSSFVAQAQYTLSRSLPLAERSGTGTSLTLGDNNSSAALNIGFSFPFFGNSYTQFYLNSNGYISFGQGNTQSWISIPSSSSPNNIIAFAGTNLHAGRGTPTINYFTTGSAPNRILVVNFKNVQHNSSASNLTSVQIQLYENGNIELHNTTNTAGGYTRTIGIEDSVGSFGITDASINTSTTLAVNGEMIRFERCTPAPSVSISSNATSLCQAPVLTANPSPSGAYTFQWYRNSSAITGATAATFAPNTIGDYKVRVEKKNGCMGSAESAFLTISSGDFTPAFYVGSAYYNTANTTRTASLCTGGEVELWTTYTSSGTTYQWYKDGAALSGATSATYMANMLGKYQLHVTRNGCTMRTDTIAIVQGSLPAISVSVTGNPADFVICENTSGNYLQANISPSTSVNYQWYYNNEIITNVNGYRLTSNLRAGTYKVEASVYNTYGCGVMSTPVQVKTKYNVSASPASYDFCNKGTGEVKLNGTVPSGSYTYRWKSASIGSNSFYDVYPHSTAASHTVNTQDFSGTGMQYLLQATRTSDNCAVSSNAIAVTKPFNVSASTDTIKICSGGSMTRYISAWGGASGNFSFQLYKNGSPVGSAVSASSGAEFAFDSPGTYFARITKGGCTIDTRKFIVVQMAQPDFTVSITPENPQTCQESGNSVELSAVVSKPGSYTYQWYRNDVPWETSSNLYAYSLGNYRVEVSLAGCTVAATKTVIQTFQPVISPASGSYCENSPVTLTASVPGGGGYTYQWQEKSSPTSSFFNTISGATGTTYQPTKGGTYRVRATVSGGYCANLSDTVRITQPFTVVLGTSSNKICFNQPVILTSTVSGSGGATFQWYLNGSLIGGATGVTYGASTAGTYSVRVTRSGCSIKSNSIVLTDGGGGTAFTVGLTAPSNTQICDGANSLLTGSVSPASGSYTYSWTRDGQSYYGSSLCPTISQAGTYRLKVTDGNGCSIESSPVTFTKPNINPVIAEPACGFSSLTASVTPAGNYKYQWYGSGIRIEGANTATYTPKEDGSYAAVVYSADGCGVRSNYIYPSDKSPFQSTSATNNLVGSTGWTGSYCPGQSIQLSAAYTLKSGMEGAVSYQWSGPKNFSSTMANPVLNAVTEGMSGTYTVVISINGACNFSVSSTTTVNIRPVTVETAGSIWVCEGQAMYINAVASHTNIVATYAWSGPAGYTSNGQYANRTNFAASHEGVYTVTATVTGQCPTTVSAKRKVVIVSSADQLSAGISVSENCGSFNLYGTASMGGQSLTSGVNYNWTGPNGFTSTSSSPYVARSAATAGTYTVTVSMCGKTTTASVTVSANEPTWCVSLCGKSGSVFMSIPEYESFIPGSVAVITPNVSPLVAENTFNWTGPNGFVSNKKQLYLSDVNKSHEGVYILNAGFKSGFTPTSISREVVLAVGPAAVNKSTPLVTINSTSGVCAGENLTLPSLSFAPSEAANYAIYSWTGPGGFTSEARQPVIPNAGTNRNGTYTLVVTFQGKYSGNATVTTTIQVNPAISILGVDQICVGQGAQLSATGWISESQLPKTNITYSWTGPNGFTSSANSIYANSVGTYSLSVTKTGGYCSGTFTASKTVTARTGNSLPGELTVGTSGIGSSSGSSVIQPSGIYQQGDNFRLYALVANADSYTWTGPGGFTYTGQNAYVFSATPARSGTYTVTAKVRVANCSGTQSLVNVTKTIAVTIVDCANIVMLSSPADNYSGGTQSKQAAKVGGKIIGTNKITGTASVTYEAGTVELLPGFTVEPGAIFKAQISGCN
jgi:hypothetical protein